MPTILVLRQPEDVIYDEIEIDDSEVEETVKDLYEKLQDADYSIEVKWRNSY